MRICVEHLPGAAFLAFPDMQPLLAAELKERFGYDAGASRTAQAANASNKTIALTAAPRWYGDLLYCPDWQLNADLASASAALPYWACTAMLQPQLIRFDSIGEAARALKAIQRSWAPYQFQLFRRASLIQEKLPHVNAKPRAFPLELPRSPIGLYTLLDEKTMLVSAATTSVLPAGALVFEEDHVNPPSRAYLKLQEALVLARHYFGVKLPSVGTHCFEAGACPGGWTWVLRQLGADVLAVDRAPLAPTLMADSHVEFRTHDAFTLKPAELGTFDWVFSDVICYPSRLLDWVQLWLESGCTRNMICTIKMQGAVDWALVAQFAAIPHSRVVHLNYNKHELTWLHVEPMREELLTSDSGGTTAPTAHALHAMQTA